MTGDAAAPGETSTPEPGGTRSSFYLPSSVVAAEHEDDLVAPLVEPHFMHTQSKLGRLDWRPLRNERPHVVICSSREGHDCSNQIARCCRQGGERGDKVDDLVKQAVAQGRNEHRRFVWQFERERDIAAQPLFSTTNDPDFAKLIEAYV